VLAGVLLVQRESFAFAAITVLEEMQKQMQERKDKGLKGAERAAAAIDQALTEFREGKVSWQEAPKVLGRVIGAVNAADSPKGTAAPTPSTTSSSSSSSWVDTVRSWLFPLLRWATPSASTQQPDAPPLRSSDEYTQMLIKLSGMARQVCSNMGAGEPEQEAVLGVLHDIKSEDNPTLLILTTAATGAVGKEVQDLDGQGKVDVDKESKKLDIDEDQKEKRDEDQKER
jgi:hypothetical protein